MRAYLVVMVVCCAAMTALGAVGDWKTYTAKRDVRDIVADGPTIWAATSGGMFSFSLKDSTFIQFTTSEGLKTIDLTAITVDHQHCVWIGASNGFLHRYNPTTKAWQYVADIALRTDPQKGINRLQVSGDTLFILSDIGVSIFSISRMEFGDTYTRFGNQPNQIIGNATAIQLFQNMLWVGTRNGAASTLLSNTNPSAPESWQVYTTSQGLPSNSIRNISIDYDSLFVGTSNGLASFNGTNWNLESAASGMNIVGMSSGVIGAPNCSENCSMFIITSAALMIFNPLDGSVQTVWSSFSAPLTSLVVTQQNTADISVVGTDGQGLATFSASSGIGKFSISPPGPPSNEFVGIAVDQRGVIWSGTGTSNRQGFMSYDGKAWKSFTSQTDNRLGAADFYKVNIGKDNSKWVSGWGDGVVLLDDQGTIRKVLNVSNGLLPSIDPTFVVVGGVATDPNGVAWIVDRTPPGDTALVTFSPDSSLRKITGISTRSGTVTVFTDIVIDNFGTKWFANFSRFEGVIPNGLYYYNESIALPGAIGGWGKLTLSDGLTTNKVYSLAVDNDGALWIGSDQGLSIIFDPGGSLFPEQYHPLQDQIIQSIVVDPLNNKWIGTRQGVFVLSSDGTSILNRYTVESTDGKLLDNDIASIALDSRNGVMYFGTERGLSSLSTTAVAPARTFSEITVAPNPYYVPSPVSLTIDGLVQGSLIKILTVDGSLVKEIRSPGGRIGFWDGTNTRGDLVATGVYLVVAYAEDGSQVAAGKVAVLRK